MGGCHVLRDTYLITVRLALFDADVGYSAERAFKGTEELV